MNAAAATTPPAEDATADVIARERQEAAYARQLGSLFALPFLSMKPKHGIDSYWAPRPFGEYAEDCEIGRCYGLAAVRYIREFREQNLLGHIVMSMAGQNRARRDRGIVVGMMAEISRAAMNRGVYS